MFGLTTLGALHTAIAIVAVAAGLLALVRDKAITPDNGAGKTYLWATVITCLTGFGIFQRGGFGAPHMLGIVTLVTLGIAMLAARTTILGRASRYVSTVAFSLTFFFHMIPGLTETFTRVPVGSPLFSGPEDPALQKVVGVFFLLFLIGAALQVKRLWSGSPGTLARTA
jgi:uncharacterized membrane protein